MGTGREERFEQLSAQVSAPLRAYATRRLPASEVDDVLAETSVVLWRRLDDVPSEPLPWCYGVLRRVLANRRRAESRRAGLLARLRTNQMTPVGTDDDFDDVHRALAALAELDREVVRLWAWEQLEPREIAVVTGLTPNAVSIRLHRSRRRLEQLLGRSRKDPGHAGHEPVDEQHDQPDQEG